MARCKVKAGYHYIGKNRTSFGPGHVFENLTKAEIGDQAWKLEKLPSRKKDEAPGTDSMGRTQHSVVEEEKLPPVKSEEEIAAEEAEAARIEEERLEKEKEDENSDDENSDDEDEKDPEDADKTNTKNDDGEEKGSIFSRKKRKKN